LATDHWSSATWQCAGTPVIAETSEMGLGFFNFQDESHPQENIDVFSGLNYNSHSPTKRGTTEKAEINEIGAPALCNKLKSAGPGFIREVNETNPFDFIPNAGERCGSTSSPL